MLILKFLQHRFEIVVGVLFCLTGAIGDHAWATSTARVIDGDTIELNGIVYRLHGIDAPEAGQKCSKPKGKSWDCGKAAISTLEKLVVGQTVDCNDRGQDGYGRTIAVCKVGGEDINGTMVASGHAWAFRKYSNDYIDVENQAHQNRIGVWITDDETAPWNYRAEQWQLGLQEAPDGCPIKGNISENGLIYHTPWSPWYKKTRIDIKEGERWFCDEEQALKAGWRAPYWGQ